MPALYYMVIIMVLVFCLGILVTVFYFMNEKIKLTQLEMYEKVDFEQKEMLLDRIISETFDSYKINNPNYALSDEVLGKEDIITIIKEVTANTIIKMTPAVRANIKFIYVIDDNNDDQLITIIGEKVTLLVMNFAATKNSNM